VPLSAVESDELCIVNASDRLGARVAFLGVEEAVAEDAVRSPGDRRELFPSDRHATVRALEAFAMPRSTGVHDARLGDRFTALGALLAVLKHTLINNF